MESSVPLVAARTVGRVGDDPIRPGTLAYRSSLGRRPAGGRATTGRRFALGRGCAATTARSTAVQSTPVHYLSRSQYAFPTQRRTSPRHAWNAPECHQQPSLAGCSFAGPPDPCRQHQGPRRCVSPRWSVVVTTAGLPSWEGMSIGWSG
jgi:hypothetical protein